MATVDRRSAAKEVSNVKEDVAGEKKLEVDAISPSSVKELVKNWEKSGASTPMRMNSALPRAPKKLPPTPEVTATPSSTPMVRTETTTHKSDLTDLAAMLDRATGPVEETAPPVATMAKEIEERQPANALEEELRAPPRGTSLPEDVSRGGRPQERGTGDADADNRARHVPSLAANEQESTHRTVERHDAPQPTPADAEMSAARLEEDEEQLPALTDIKQSEAKQSTSKTVTTAEDELVDDKVAVEGRSRQQPLFANESDTTWQRHALDDASQEALTHEEENSSNGAINTSSQFDSPASPSEDPTTFSYDAYSHVFRKLTLKDAAPSLPLAQINAPVVTEVKYATPRILVPGPGIMSHRGSIVSQTGIAENELGPEAVKDLEPGMVVEAGEGFGNAGQHVVTVLPVGRKSSITRIPETDEQYSKAAPALPDHQQRPAPHFIDSPGSPINSFGSGSKAPRLPALRFSNIPLGVKLNLPPNKSSHELRQDLGSQHNLTESIRFSTAERLMSSTREAIGSPASNATEDGGDEEIEARTSLSRSLSGSSLDDATDEGMSELAMRAVVNGADHDITFRRNTLRCIHAKGKFHGVHFNLRITRILVVSNRGSQITLFAVPTTKLSSPPKLRQFTFECADGESAAVEWCVKFNYVACQGNFSPLVEHKVVFLVDDTEQDALRDMISRYIAPVLECVGKKFDVQVVPPATERSNAAPATYFGNANYVAHVSKHEEALSGATFESWLLKGAMEERDSIDNVIFLPSSDPLDPAELGLSIVKALVTTSPGTVVVTNVHLKRSGSLGTFFKKIKGKA
ncbi:uncharacterized protein EV422DRAFT_88070 [Fimicolochytrium jonesii]|uniref:uncharacterized protein n=1 Tax=Fimicolochytrium jonesii TaxID=1396493 RepID=UPI0022FDE46E|nr:uncharacterized protein EV422DRAFT_88070 [Fimicolochytrium jonesii]KAI8819840.1 hypothetical protein EV422DRAFT_88070 [Fimicolochytrium jonesii]